MVFYVPNFLKFPCSQFPFPKLKSYSHSHVIPIPTGNTTGVAHLVVHGTSGSTSYETIPHVRLETSGSMLSTVDKVLQRGHGPRRLRGDHDNDKSHCHSHLYSKDRVETGARD